MKFIFIMTENHIETGLYSDTSSRIYIDWHKHQDEYGYDVRADDDLPGFWDWFQQVSGITPSDELAVLLLCEAPEAAHERLQSVYSFLRDKLDMAVGVDNCWDARDLKRPLADHLGADALDYDELRQVFLSGNRQWFVTGLSGAPEDVVLTASPDPVEDERLENGEEPVSEVLVFLRPEEQDIPEEDDKKADEPGGLCEDADSPGDVGKCTGADLKRYINDATKDHCDTIR